MYENYGDKDKKITLWAFSGIDFLRQALIVSKGKCLRVKQRAFRREKSFIIWPILVFFEQNITEPDIDLCECERESAVCRSAPLQ